VDAVFAQLGLAGVLHPGRILLVGALIAARILPVFVLAPLFGGRVVPATAKLAVSLAFAALVYPAVEAGTPDLGPLGPVLLVALFLKEILLGATIAYLVSLPFWAAEAAGRLVDTARGASFSEVLVPQLGTRTSPLADFSMQLVVVLFFSTGLHLVFLRALGASFETVPVWGFSAAEPGLLALAVSTTTRLFWVALGLAAPVLAALFLTDLALGFVSRVAPQIQIFFIGMPAKAVLGVTVFLLALSSLAFVLSAELRHAMSDVARALELFGR
jgi:type III secretion protein SpaR/YscT/HrcT